MNAYDHRRVMTELDALKQQVASTIQRFEVTDSAVDLKGDYGALD